ncbi:hypothetical protein B0H11DRAFT_833201 [Mycena galericulata]|nr:hypothetical protein B0H11DRAFT_833201 [Mycena galericulata]
MGACAGIPLAYRLRRLGLWCISVLTPAHNLPRAIDEMTGWGGKRRTLRSDRTRNALCNRMGERVGGIDIRRQDARKFAYIPLYFVHAIVFNICGRFSLMHTYGCATFSVCRSARL